MSPQNSLVSLALSLVATLALGCTDPDLASDAPPDRPLAVPRPKHVVMVLVDTTRADHLGFYGYERPTTEMLGRRTPRAVVFEHARSQASCTFPSANSLLTSKRPTYFYGRGRGHHGIPDETSSIAEVLGKAGFATLAVSASPIVRNTPSEHNLVGGFGRGFDVFDESCEDDRAACINAKARELLDAVETREPGRPTFLYLHYMDPHHPYEAPGRFRHHFADATMAPDWPSPGDPRPILRRIYKRGEKKRWPRHMKYLEDSYDDEIRYWDFEFEKFLGWLDETGRSEDTMVVIVSDHGEDFLEHEHLMHCRSLYETSIHVPLVMWVPGLPGRRVPDSVRNLDVLPTITDYLGIEDQAYGFEGASLRPLMEGGVREEVPMTFAYQGQMRGVFDGRYKLVYHLAKKTVALYDLETDPHEKSDLAEAPEAEAVRKQLQRALLEHIKGTEGQGDTQRASRVSERMQNGLRALGYLE